MSDSTPDTLAHIRNVQTKLAAVCAMLQQRAIVHDQSKLEPPEKEGYDQIGIALKGLTYGSPEYRESLKRLKPTIEHHYAHNSHHPEYHKQLVCIICFSVFPVDWGNNCNECGNGTFSTETSVARMTLLDVLEMLCDWKAAGERNADGNIVKSIKINTERFKLDKQLAGILTATAAEMGWVKEEAQSFKARNGLGADSRDDQRTEPAESVAP